MNRMTTQQRLDCLLKQFDALAQYQGDVAVLNEHDVSLLKKQCGFVNLHEIALYLRSLHEKGLLSAECSADDTILQAHVTIGGYCYLETLTHP